MHASLASIGRACNVEDEEPPESSPSCSIDGSSDVTETWITSHSGGWCLRELVESGVATTQSIQIVPLIEKAVRHENLATENRNSSTLSAGSSCEEVQQPETVAQLRESSTSNSPAHLNRLTQLHRCCQLTRSSVAWDLIGTNINELTSGSIPLSVHSNNITRKEYDLLEDCLSEFTHIPLSPKTMFSTAPYNHSAYKPKFSRPSAHSGWVRHTTGTARNSQLNELRVFCESLRQCLTQCRHVYHEQSDLINHLRLWANKTCGDPSPFPSALSSRLAETANQLTLASLLSAHHLTFSGLSTLAHTDLITLRHGDLWEMMRGVEELDILSRHLRSTIRPSRSQSLRQFLSSHFLSRKTYGWNSCSLALQLMRSTLLCDPFESVFPISIGYLFVILAHQRSIRLAHTVYHQLCAIISCDEQKINEAAGDVKTSTNLVEAFRDYLSRNYDRTASECLRAEYEFIATLLDVISQSTNMLYQVQKLKLVYNAAAAAVSQAKKSACTTDSQVFVPVSTYTQSDSRCSRAVSVEGKRGILIRRGSADKASRVHTTNVNRGILTQYQDTLQRACTLDRYVATGSASNPLNTSESGSLSEEPQCKPTNSSTECADVHLPIDTSPATGKVPAKKVVQWSDHREISTRHQVIGRFLEMIWRCTEAALTTLFFCPPASSLVQLQYTNLSYPNHSPTAESPKSSIMFAFLKMPPKQLRWYSNHIKELNKSDIFPAGLVPVLKRLALRLDEVAHNRDHYTELLRDTQVLRKFVSKKNASAHRSECDVSKTSSSNGFFNMLDAFTSDASAASVTLECAVNYLRSLSNHSPSFRNIPSTCVPHQWGLYFHSPQVQLDLTSLLYWLFKSAQFCSRADQDQCNMLTRIVQKQLSILGISIDFEVGFPSACSTQPSTMLHASCDFSRRVNEVTVRLITHLSVSIQLTTEHFINELCTLTNFPSDSSTSPTDQLEFAIRLTSAFVAESAQFIAVVNLLLYVSRTVQRCLQQHFVKPGFKNLSSTFPDTDCIRTASAEKYQTTEQRIAPSRWGLSNGVLAAKTMATLRLLDRSLKSILSELQQSNLTAQAQFEHICDRIIEFFCSTMFAELIVRPIPPERLVQFVDTLLPSPDTHCTSEVDGPHLDDAPHTITCGFHSMLYQHILLYPFMRFCSQWIEAIDPYCCGLLTKPTFVRNHTTSVQILQDALFVRQSHVPISLMATYCGCDSFSRLQASTFDPCCELPCSSNLSHSNEHSSSEIDITAKCSSSMINLG